MPIRQEPGNWQETPGRKAGLQGGLACRRVGNLPPDYPTGQLALLNADD